MLCEINVNYQCYGFLISRLYQCCRQQVEDCSATHLLHLSGLINSKFLFFLNAWVDSGIRLCRSLILSGQLFISYSSRGGMNDTPRALKGISHLKDRKRENSDKDRVNRLSYSNTDPHLLHAHVTNRLLNISLTCLDMLVTKHSL